MRRGLVLVALLAAGVAEAQVRNYEVLGNLEATVNPGCIAAAGADPALSPPDLGLGVLTCAKAGDFGRGVELYILMQLRAEFDKRRVADATAHQAEDVLSGSVSAAMTAKQLAEFQAAFGAFGGDGSPGHRAFCAAQKQAGPPAHSPRWMVAHGMGAVLGETEAGGLKPGFRAKAAWSRLMRDYLNCGG